MKLALPPGIVFVARNDRRADKFPGETTRGMIPVKVSPELAPKPIDDTSFYGYGRDPQHTWPQREVVNGLNIAYNGSVMAPHFMSGLPARPGSMIVQMAHGQFAPAVGRPNIDPAEQVTYGSLTSLLAPQVYSPAYMKLYGG